MQERPVLWTVYLIMPVTTFFWALGHPLGKIILGSVHPMQLESINLVVGFLRLLAYLSLTGLRNCRGQNYSNPEMELEQWENSGFLSPCRLTWPAMVLAFNYECTWEI